jgi:hypothetical protein
VLSLFIGGFHRIRKGNVMNTIERIKELYQIRDKLTPFEKGFICDNASRVAKWGEDTRFSEKQANLVDRIYKERIVEGKAASAFAHQQ